jgi:hypothetical protein
LTVPRLKRTLLLGTRFGQVGAPLIPAPGEPYYLNYTYDPLNAGIATPPPADAAPFLPVVPPPTPDAVLAPGDAAAPPPTIFAGPYGAAAPPPSGPPPTDAPATSGAG